MATFKAIVLIFSSILICFYVVEGKGGHGRDIGPPPTIFNVLQFGAVGNGKKDNTQPFMKAWIAACHWRGNSRLLIPDGIFVIGPVVFQGPCNGPRITVQVKGTLKATTDISEYADGEWVSFESISNLQLTGGGTFDGQGSAVWEYNDCKTNSDCQMLATSIKFNKISNSNVRRITSINPMGFHMALNNCQNVGLQSVTITAPPDSPNTDGVHISEASGIKVTRSKISTGDDCISIGHGTNDITINKVTCGPGHGISIGSLGKRSDEKDVNGINVFNCTLTDTDNGVRIKTWGNSPILRATNLNFRDLIMNNVDNPIIIDQSYCPRANCKEAPSNVQISDVHYTNIVGTSRANIAVSLMCSQKYPCQNVQLSGINLQYTGKKPAVAGTTSECANVKVGYSGNNFPPPCPH